MLQGLSKIYGYFTSKRNREFDSGKRASASFELPIISVGNLNTGGTGKTPHVEYLIDLLKPHFNIGVLSRGYGRKTKGFRLAGQSDSSATLGDEPFQYYKKYSTPSRASSETSINAKRVYVAVSEQRVLGASELINRVEPDVILLDDAFQHRYIRPGFQILLTTFQEPYTRDQLLPAGRLRESASGAVRADVIIVTKCPKEMTQEEKQNFRTELGIEKHQSLFFSKFGYEAIRPEGEKKIENPKRAFALCGIAKPEHFLKEVKKHFELKGLQVYKDHHRFTVKDLKRLRRDATPFLDGETVLLTTEKDLMRLLPLKEYWKDLPLYSWPIKPEIDRTDEFDQLILDYVRKSK